MDLNAKIKWIKLNAIIIGKFKMNETKCKFKINESTC